MVCHFQYHSNFQCMQFIKSTLIPLKKTHIHALLLHTFKHIFFSVFYMDLHVRTCPGWEGLIKSKTRSYFFLTGLFPLYS